jgi:hypothetical protein
MRFRCDMSPTGVRRATLWQDAVRLLLLIDAAAEDVGDGTDVPEGTVGVVRTQVKVQKLDFWLRYPDYLANELLNEFDQYPDDPGLVRLAGRILDSDEPDLRRLPMLRGKFGAFEQMDTAMAVLVSRGLVTKRDRLGEKRVIRHDYYLLAAGRETVRDLLAEAPSLAWYAKRTRLLVALTEGLGGTDLKTRQYLQREYADTPTGSYIPPITERVRARLREVRERLARAGGTPAMEGSR